MQALNSTSVVEQIKEHFGQIAQLLVQLPKEELLKIRWYEFGENFAWNDAKGFYEEQPPMVVGDEPMLHGEAIYLQLLLSEALEADALGDDVEDFYQED